MCTNYGSHLFIFKICSKSSLSVNISLQGNAAKRSRIEVSECLVVCSRKGWIGRGYICLFEQGQFNVLVFFECLWTEEHILIDLGI